jgi:hypothetical protein
MNEFGEHGPTRDPAFGDTTGEGAAPPPESTTDATPERGREGSSPTAPDVDQPAGTAPPAGREHGQAGMDAARGALSEHE